MAGLGWTPYYEDINLRTGYDWIPDPIQSDRMISPDTVAEVKWANGTTWAGSVDGDTGPTLNRLSVQHISRRTDVGNTGQG